MDGSRDGMITRWVYLLMRHTNCIVSLSAAASQVQGSFGTRSLLQLDKNEGYRSGGLPEGEFDCSLTK